MELTILMVTHDLEEAFFLADRISVLIDGVIQQTDAKEQLYQHPRTVPVARYLGIRNLFEGEVAGHSNGLVAVRCRGLGRTLQVAWDERNVLPAPGTCVVVGIRSDEVKIVHPEFEQMAPHNPFLGRIEALYAKGASHTLVLRAPDAPGQAVELEVGNRVMRKLHLAPGVECTVDFKPSLLNLMPAPETMDRA
jgi:ABC-type Fe3+/spermidine/putrescine transport system ATPase subunit